jgi:DNA-directed RNA polymerase
MATWQGNAAHVAMGMPQAAQPYSRQMREQRVGFRGNHPNFLHSIGKYSAALECGRSRDSHFAGFSCDSFHLAHGMAVASAASIYREKFIHTYYARFICCHRAR